MKINENMLNLKNWFISIFHKKESYIFLALFALLVGACFYEPIIYGVAVLVLISSIFLSITYALSMLLFLFPFYALFIMEKGLFFGLESVYMIIFACVSLILAIKHLILIIKKQVKINFVIAGLFVLFLIYLLLPIRKDASGNLSPVCSVGSFLTFGCLFVVLYIILKEKNKINFLTIFKAIVIGFIIAGFLGFLRPVSERLQNVIGEFSYNDNIFRFCGLAQHPNSIAIYSTFIISGILYLHYNNKLGIEVYLYFPIVFMFGYMTVSRSFLYSFILCFVIYVVAVIVKERKNCYKKLLPLLLELVAISLILLKYTICHLERLGISDLIHGYGDSVDLPLEDLENINDPGRGGLLKKYLYDFISTPLILLFGRGISYPNLGGLATHNFYLQVLWNVGIVGTILLILITCFYIYYFSELKVKDIFVTAFKDVSFYFLIITYLMIFFVESIFPGIYFCLTVFYLLTAVCSVKVSKIEDMKNNIDENILKEKKEM